MAGGVALNCVATGKLLEQTDLKALFIQPGAGDDGGSLGAALFLYHQIFGNKDRTVIKDYNLNALDQSSVNQIPESAQKSRGMQRSPSKSIRM